MTDVLKRSEAAAKYRPDRTRVLFIAEAPPNELERYFYFENVTRNDWLWLGLMKALFERDFGETRFERKRKAYWLTRFRDCGFQLIDAVEEPLEGNARHKRALIDRNAPHLLSRIRQIGPAQVVLIKSTVHEALFGALAHAGFHVLNERALPFPASNHQTEFDAEMRQLINSGSLRIC